MIYTHGNDGRICEYDEKSGIKYIMSYTCGSVKKGCVFEDIKPFKHIHLASYSMEHLEFLVERYETEEPYYLPSGKCSPIYCVIGRDGKSYNWHSRKCIEIDWGKDYHFYDDKDEEIIDKVLNHDNKN